jgi:hypothetical protein
METPDFTPVVDRASPRHRWFEEQNQYRLKVQSYTSAPPEITVQKISFEKEFDRYRHAADKGYTSCFPIRGKRVQSDQPRSIESLERAQFRAKTNVRKLVTELAPTALVTFTTRELLTIDQLLWVWQKFGVLMRSAGIEFEYVAVPERHPTNPDHIHLHAAYRGRTPFNLLRRFWHMALEARHGRRVAVVLRGAESPGNIDVQTIKCRDDIKRIRKIAKYIAKYITKDLISEFNRKRYWPSKGISLESAKVYWLDSLSQAEAVREACRMVGEWVDDLDVCSQKVWSPSDRVAFFAVDPARTPPPPF